MALITNGYLTAIVARLKLSYTKIGFVMAMGTEYVITLWDNGATLEYA